METALKERLVGAAVLVTLAVIFIPLVLDGPDAPEQTPATSDATIVQTEADGTTSYRFPLTETPAAGTVPATAVKPSETVRPPAPAETAASEPKTSAGASSETVAGKTAGGSPAPAVSPPVKPSAAGTAAKPGGDTAWAVQVGSFSREASARTVSGDLARHGFKAFVTRYSENGKTFYRVRVGPVATRAEAETLARRVSQATGDAARVVPHPR